MLLIHRKHIIVQCRKALLTLHGCRMIINSLAPGRFDWNFRRALFKQILVIDGWGISCEIGLIWMSLDFTDDQSTLVQVMAWCRQATSHYLNHCWPRSPTPYVITRPQWVKGSHFTCLLKGLTRPTTKTPSKLHITGPSWGESTGEWWMPLITMDL